MSLRFSKRGGHEVTEAEKRQIVLSGRCSGGRSTGSGGWGDLLRDCVLVKQVFSETFLYFLGGD